MRSLPLPLALAARLSPVVVLACAGWALSSSPASPEDAAAQGDGTRQTRSETDGAPSSPAATKAYAAAPAPCGSVSAKTLTSLVPGAKTAGKEIPSTDTKVRRTCSWNALKGFDYRWLDVSFEIMDTEDAALKSYKARVGEKSGGGPVPGLGQEAYSVVNLTTEDKQQTREGVVFARVSNAIVIVTYNGSDFETRKAPDTSTINTGAIKAAKEAMGALQGGTTG
ncbi:hypothetical protein PV682_04995 [Streptomyces niveiscabiei]|uniref:hypothetical protein n=1 Tax=Streptomyces niveiscabiei TaxID=164115 RepID=UPI0029B4D342|nr:hypothetical protein [Streptomyces niveiscabiei]MDX3380805.1 hypothetical protein [Streptomyces niveiscabiei]